MSLRRPSGGGDKVKRELHVAFLTAAGPWSGAEVHTRDLAIALYRCGHRVTVVHMGEPVYSNASLPSGISIISLRSLTRDAPKWRALNLSQWLSVCRRLSADIIILVKGNFELGSHALGAAARIESRAFLTVEHMHAPVGEKPATSWTSGKLPRISLWWYRKRLSGFLRSIFPNKTICVSAAVTRTLNVDYGFSSRKLLTAYTGVDTERFAPNLLARQSLRASLDIVEDAFVFGTVGRLSPMKNQRLLVSAFSELCRETARDIRLIIAGEGPMKSELEAQVRELDLKERVHFLDFSATPENVYPAFDVFCLTSTGEALGIALLEAMSCGVPAVATAVGGVPEIINDPSVGYLVPAGEPSSYKVAMAQTLELNTDAVNVLAAASRRRIVHDFDAAACFRELVDAIIKAASHRDL